MCARLRPPGRERVKVSGKNTMKPHRMRRGRGVNKNETEFFSTEKRRIEDFKEKTGRRGKAAGRWPSAQILVKELT